MRHGPAVMLWDRLVAFCFRLLYNELAWTYDAVSWLASRGRWRDWQRTILAHLPRGGRVLEVGCGPGHTLVDVASTGHAIVGADRSAWMLRLAQRRMASKGLQVPLLRGRASRLPLASQSFDALVSLFPTSYAYQAAWADEVVRVLRDGGRLVIAELAFFTGRSTSDRALEKLYEVTGQRGPAPDLVDLLTRAGLTAWTESAEVEDSRVALVIADKPVVRDSRSGNGDAWSPAAGLG